MIFNKFYSPLIGDNSVMEQSQIKTLSDDIPMLLRLKKGIVNLST